MDFCRTHSCCIRTALWGQQDTSGWAKTLERGLKHWVTRMDRIQVVDTRVMTGYASDCFSGFDSIKTYSSLYQSVPLCLIMGLEGSQLICRETTAWRGIVTTKIMSELESRFSIWRTTACWQVTHSWATLWARTSNSAGLRLQADLQKLGSNEHWLFSAAQLRLTELNAGFTISLKNIQILDKQ